MMLRVSLLVSTQEFHVLQQLHTPFDGKLITPEHSEMHCPIESIIQEKKTMIGNLIV